MSLNSGLGRSKLLEAHCMNMYYRQTRTDPRLVNSIQAEHRVDARILVVSPEGEAVRKLLTLLQGARYELTHLTSLQTALEAFLAAPERYTVLLCAEQYCTISQLTSLTHFRAKLPRSIPFLIFFDAQESVQLSPACLEIFDGYLPPIELHERFLYALQAHQRTARHIQYLEEGQISLVGAAFFSAQAAQLNRSELLTQQLLHKELLHRVHTHVVALRDYLELEVKRVPIGIAREAMWGVLYRVRHLSALYETMFVLGSEEQLEISSLLAKVSYGLKALYSPRSKLPIVVEGELHMSVNSASALIVIINELVTNAFRHAFPGGRFGAIRVICGRSEDTGWCKVIDDGVGIELPSAVPHNGGITLVRQIARRTLGGHCNWENSGKGTIATVQFPLAAP
jgi:two-component sensor histidine kinase